MVGLRSSASPIARLRGSYSSGKGKTRDDDPGRTLRGDAGGLHHRLTVPLRHNFGFRRVATKVPK
jgi:hypothetical protein